MKKRFFMALVTGSLLLSVVVLDRANPIIEGFFNEVVFDASGWKLEMHVMSTATLDGWYLTSRSGQAYFRNGIQLAGVYRVITAESLLSPLAISQLGDSVSIHSPQMAHAFIVFGAGGFVPAPRIGQSMCLRESGTQFYYLDNTPTLGQPNDALNAMGIVQGRIADSLGRPISGVLVSWGEPFPLVYSDSGGNFSVTEYARGTSFTFTHSHFATRNMSVQIWPESTVVIGVTMDRIVNVEEEGESLPPGFRLLTNHPNPFNPTTNIDYQLPSQVHVTLKVFDVQGRDISSLVDESKEAGLHTATWNAEGLPSGVYFCRLRVGSHVGTIKMLLLR